jgi:ribosome maturation factor RimP
MITKDYIKEFAEEKIAGSDMYIVDVKILPANKIVVFFDKEYGKVSIQDCVDLSRHIESKLNRDELDFEIEVSSPGMDEPFKSFKQYVKHYGKEVSVITKHGLKITGKLLDVTPEKISVETTTKEKIEGKKGKQTVIKNNSIPFEEIKETKLVINF